MIIDCIADLHGEKALLEGGDLLIVAGDLTAKDTRNQHYDFWRWICYQNYKKCVVIAGNHDNFLQKNPDTLQNGGENLCYLCDSGTEFQGLKIWGAPWTHQFPNMNPHCKAFTRPYLQSFKDRWDLIPDDVDILITHGPPNGILDKVARGKNESVGDMDLALAVTKRIRPKLHVYGHIHEGYGQFRMKHWPIIDGNGKVFHTTDTLFVNCSLMNEKYAPVNKPVRIIL